MPPVPFPLLIRLNIGNSIFAGVVIEENDDGDIMFLVDVDVGDIDDDVAIALPSGDGAPCSGNIVSPPPPTVPG